MPRKLVVMKFGGTSLATPARIRAAARRIARERMRGWDALAVVSARGSATDDLLADAAKLAKHPAPREIDALLATGEQASAALLALALEAIGCRARSVTAHQIGILTDDNHRAAKIRAIDPRPLRRVLAAGAVPVVTGFIAVDAGGSITTMGRGASDKTAVVLAAVLKAKRCEIYTDVKGVYTADPNVVPDARRIPALSHEEMLEFAAMGARVMHAGAVEWGQRFGVPIDVRSAFSPAKGTRIGTVSPSRLSSRMAGLDRSTVHGAASDEDWARITLHGLPDLPGRAASIFEAVARDRINVDMILLNVPQGGFSDLSYTVLKTDLPKALANVRRIHRRLGVKAVSFDERIAKVSIVGLGMQDHYGVAARMLRALAKAGINVQAISTSEIKVSCIVPEADGARGLKVLHQAFQLRRRPKALAAGA